MKLKIERDEASKILRQVQGGELLGRDQSAVDYRKIIKIWL